MQNECICGGLSSFIVQILCIFCAWWLNIIQIQCSCWKIPHHTFTRYTICLYGLYSQACIPFNYLYVQCCHSWNGNWKTHWRVVDGKFGDEEGNSEYSYWGRGDIFIIENIGWRLTASISGLSVSYAGGSATTRSGHLITFLYKLET